MSKVDYIVGVAISLSLMLIILVCFIYFSIIKNKKKNILRKKGLETENLINKNVNIWANIHNYIYVPSSMFKYEDNKIFEVDGILITDRALVIIEAKSINGNLIYGTGNEKEWIKVVGENKHPIKSPILQNDKHIDHIVKMTNMKVPIVSLIIFDANSVKEINIKDIPAHVLIIKTNEIETTLDGIKSMLIPKITKNEMIKIHEILINQKTTKNEDKKLLQSFAKEFDEKTFTI